MPRPTVLVRLTVILAVATCCRSSREVARAPRFLLGISPAPGFVVLGATLYADRDIRYRDARCLGVPTQRGEEPAMLDAGRTEFWVVGGDVLGHADRSPTGRYRAAVRTTLGAGTAVSASLGGSATVDAHRFHTPAHVPRPVRRVAPAPGFDVRPGVPFRASWEGGDSTHVAIVLDAAPRDGDPDGAGYLLTCVVAREPGSFVIPAAALAPLGTGARTVTVTLAADDRVEEGEYALDVTPVGTADDPVAGRMRP